MQETKYEELNRRIDRLEKVLENKRINEILGFSKEEKFDKCQALYEKLLWGGTLKRNSEYSDDDTAYYFCSPFDGDKAWDSFNDLGNLVNKFIGRDGGMLFVVPDKSKTEKTLDSIQSDSKKGESSTQINKVQDLDEYTGIYVTNYSDDSSRKITFYVNKKPQAYIKVDFKKVQKWLESSFNKKMGDLINNLKSKFKKQIIFAR